MQPDYADRQSSSLIMSYRTNHRSELHVYRGHQSSDTGHIMGHEFTGAVVQVGSAVKSIKIGDKVVAPFTASWYVMSTPFIYPTLTIIVASAITASMARRLAALRVGCSGPKRWMVDRPNMSESQWPMAPL